MQPVVTPPLPTTYLSDSAASAQTNTVLTNPGDVPNRTAVKLISFSTDGATTFTIYSGTSTVKWQWVFGAAGHSYIRASLGEYLFLTAPGETLTYSTTGTNNTFVAVNCDVIQ